MKKIILIASLLLPGFALALPSNQVLVLNSAVTRVDTAAFLYRSGIVIQNNGPNTITCKVGSSSGLTTTNGYRILAGSEWRFPLPAPTPVWCIATTADQVAGAATDVTEL
jgi:hypothetical protein